MPGTAVWRQLRGVDADWSVEVAMLASVLHVLQVANWQRGADAREAKARKDYPQPLMPPSGQQKAARKSKQGVSSARLFEFQRRVQAERRGA